MVTNNVTVYQFTTPSQSIAKFLKALMFITSDYQLTEKE